MLSILLFVVAIISLLTIPDIPREATHSCWCYPPAGLSELDEGRKTCIDQGVAVGDPEYTFLAFGGFVYFKPKDGTSELVSLVIVLLRSLYIFESTNRI